MTFRFNTEYFPPEDSKEVFGCLQTSNIPSNVSSETYEWKRCKKCECLMFPTEDKTMECPICNPTAKYISQSIKKETNPDEIHKIFYFIFDIDFPLETSTEMLNLFTENLPENAKAVVMAISTNFYVLYQHYGVPLFDNIENDKQFTPSSFYFLTKSDISSIILPSLPALYNFAKADNEIDILLPLSISKMQLPADYCPHSIFCFTKREIKTISAVSASHIGSTIASMGGIINFGAAQSFKRLSAISKFSFGIVFPISTFVPSTIKKLFTASKRFTTYFVLPRAVEATKVTGGDGSVRLTPNVSIINLLNSRGASLRFNVDFSGDIPESFLVVECTDYEGSAYLTLHKFKSPKDDEEFAKSLDPDITKEIVAKGAASDILRMVFSGTEVATAVKKTNTEKLLAGTPANGVGGKPDKDTLQLYYLLHRMPCKDAPHDVCNGKGYINYPSLYILSSEKPKEVLEQNDSIEWPMELHIFEDEAALKLLLANLQSK